ncbi:MAG: DUF3048 domain-containing protein [Actinomycetes bacterium]
MTDLHRFRRVSAVVLALGLLAAGCGGDEEPEPRAEPTQTASTTPPPPPPTDPLTGAPAQPGAPLVAVKIDNAPLARPFHRGLEGASVLYLELVEGGATRFLALYSQPFGAQVGPIRSFRESDIELLGQFGRPAVGFSGANEGVLRAFRQAVQNGVLANASYDDFPNLYAIGERRRDAKNFYAVPAEMGKAADAAPAKDIGWTFAPAPPPGGLPGNAATVVMSDRSTVQLQYDAASKRYLLLQDGAPLTGFGAANVVVQQVQLRDGGYRDVTGAVTPYSVTVGTGALEVLRDGLRFQGSWNRPAPPEGTRLLGAAGAPIPLAPGPTLVLLHPAGLPFSAS